MPETQPTEPTLINALDKGKMATAIQTINEAELAIILYELNLQVYYWFKDPTEKRIKNLQHDFPILNQFINFDIIFLRLNDLGKFGRKDAFLGVHIERFMPELAIFRNLAGERLDALPRGVEKAELWLRPHAKNARANEEVEAAVYFASRGNMANINPAKIGEAWYDSICESIVRGVPLATRITPEIKELAKNRALPLSDASAVLSFHNELPMFFATKHYYDNFIYATFFRGVEWLNINEFEDWADSYAKELSVLAQNGIEHKFICWFLFYICRSDLALSKIEHEGIFSLIWLLSKGNLEAEKPWRQMSWSTKFPEPIDHLPIAASLIFAAKRIPKSKVLPELIKGCIDVIRSMQKNSGGWPIKSDDPDASIEATCLAIHALAISKPAGWKNACMLGKNWLLSQQRQSGCWTIDGAPTVMLTVLVLDSINLADEKPLLTFGKQKITTATTEPDPVYDFTGVSYYGKDFPNTKSISVDDLTPEMAPEVALAVAVEVELRQTLLNLKPLPGQRKILKVYDKNDTYYIGRFGAFNAVVMMCAMGSEGPGGSTLAIYDLILKRNPKVVIMVGIAFGIDKLKHRPGDVFVAETLLPYELQRAGEVITPRSPVPPSSTTLLNRFRNAVNWKFKRPDNTLVKKIPGAILTGGKLVDNIPFKQQLVGLFPTAIGGEMEGSGLWSASDRANKPWILIKAVCDWGDGHKHKAYQEMAAASAVSLCLNVLKDPSVLHGL